MPSSHHSYHRTLTAVGLLVLPLIAYARSQEERICRMQADIFYESDNLQAAARYEHDIAEAYEEYAFDLRATAYILDDANRSAAQRNLKNEWRDERDQAKRHYRDALNDHADARRERREECTEQAKRQSSSSRSSQSSSWSSTSSSVGYCGDGICTQQEAMILCPACAYGTPLELCRCSKQCEQDCGPYGG